jgi:hypothetical protein
VQQDHTADIHVSRYTCQNMALGTAVEPTEWAVAPMIAVLVLRR